tara:strand:- start:140 stop:1225 length:1086 start_codon:yes stop_codon:yes gene_type:complete
MSEEIKETAGGELTQGEFKVKKQVKKLTKKDTPIKIEFNKTEKAEKEITKVNLQKEDKTEKVEDVVVEITENNEEAEVKKEVTEQIVELPEGLNKLVEFMKETGGTVKDYVRLDTDFSSVDENVLLKEYYKSTKPHLNEEEITFIMDDNFGIDEDLDEERDIKKKKLAFKEEIANAKTFLEDTKDKYYQEIKLKSNVTEDQQKAMDFFNRYNKVQEKAVQQQQEFIDVSTDYFSENFKGFEFNVGEKKFNYNVSNAQNLAKDQSKISDFTKMFLNEDGSVSDHKGYHKAMYAARNADTIAKHFYEQGKSDGIKNIVDKSKNIETASRPKSNGEIYIGGLKVKAISGKDSTKLKIQTNKNKN